MEGHMPRTKDHSGQEPETYVYEEFRVQEFPYFVYKICINKYWKYGFCELSSKFIKTDKPLTIKCRNILKYYKNYTIEKEIYPIGVPYTFIKENNLSVYKPIIKKKFRKNERTR